MLISDGKTDHPVRLRCRLVPGDPADRSISHDPLTLTLRIPGAEISTSCDHGLFESALSDIQRQLPPGQFLETCISCAFSDYSPLGQGLSGDLACFRDNKAAYRAASGKPEIFKICNTRTEYAHETHLCQQYQRRVRRTGYRGGFPEP